MIIEIDGNDGVGKTTVIKELLKYNPDYKIKDRGALTTATDTGNFIKNKNTCYILLTASPISCQNRIIARGGSITEKYHTIEDLIKYHDRFIELGNKYNIPIYDTEEIKIGTEEFNELIRTINLYINEQDNIRNFE